MRKNKGNESKNLYISNQIEKKMLKIKEKGFLRNS
jgi:hypothetical protein